VRIERYPRYRSRSRSPIRPSVITPLITNATTLNTVLLENTDICVEIQSGPELYSKSIAYLTSNPFHNTDLEKLSWIFKVGVVDAWVQKPVSPISSLGVYQVDYLPPGRRGPQYVHVDEPVYDRYDRYDRRSDVPIVKLGNALKVFKDDTEESETSKVKFVTIVQGKSQPNWAKMIVSYSRQAALVDLFHEIMNGQTILFVGAVLKDAAVPAVSSKNGLVQEPKFRKVDSIKEAKVLEEEGITAFIC